MITFAAKTLLAISLLSFVPSKITRELSHYVLWNVGQGQWFTWITTHHCLHVDVGGDRLSTPLVRKFCQARQNSLIFTHFDWDHVGGVRKLRASLQQADSLLCVYLYPSQKIPLKKKRLLKGVKHCQRAPRSVLAIGPTSRSGLDANDSGLIFVVNREVLIPGDQSSRNEHLWVPEIGTQPKLGLIVPHHGSRNSSGRLLLSSFDFKWAWVSARRARYSHPHRETLLRYKRLGVPVVSTERLGHLMIKASHQGL